MESSDEVIHMSTLATFHMILCKPVLTSLPYKNRPRVKSRPVLISGALGPIRTADTRFRRAVLYPLSYEGMWDILLTST